MNDQHPSLHVGDRVTLNDPKHFDTPQSLVITGIMWDPNSGDWFATATDPQLRRSVFRRITWFTPGWP